MTRTVAALLAAVVLAFAPSFALALGEEDDDSEHDPLRLPRPGNFVPMQPGTIPAQPGVTPNRPAEFMPPDIAPPRTPSANDRPLYYQRFGGHRQIEPQSGDLLTLDQARQFMVSLINKDRAAFNLQPVELDQVASNAHQGHTNEMVVAGYHGHWGLDGKLPNQRYTEGGGTDYDMENAFYYSFNGRGPYILDEEPLFPKDKLANAEADFMNEKPPMDGHRKNILNPTHNRVGIALSRANMDDHEYRLAMTEEFVDHYGNIDPMPTQAAPGSTVHVSGTLLPGIHFHDLTLYQEALPKPMTVDELNRTYAYNFPDRIANFFPPGFGRESPVNITNTQQGERFSADITLPDPIGKGALYSIGLWVNKDGERSPMLVSMRTVEVKRKR